MPVRIPASPGVLISPGGNRLPWPSSRPTGPFRKLSHPTYYREPVERMHKSFRYWSLRPDLMIGLEHHGKR
jgi:hypothetical protein